MPVKGLPGGDFRGCVSKMQGTMDSPEGFCAWKIHDLTGKWPGRESDTGGSAMVALRVPGEAAQKLHEALPKLYNRTAPEQEHVTLLYLGEVGSLPCGKDELLEALSPLAIDTLEARVTGHSLFFGESEEDGRPLVVLVDSPALPSLRYGVEEVLRKVGVESPSEHGFIPHVTLARVYPGEESSLGDLSEVRMVFEGLYLVYGDEWNRVQGVTKKEPAPGSTSTGGTLHEAAGGLVSSFSDAPGGEPYALVKGRMLVEGRSKQGNLYTPECLPSFIQEWAGKPIRVNHPSKSEREDRPEGNAYDQIGVLPGVEDFWIGEVDGGEFAEKQAIFFKNARLSTSPADAWVRDRIKSGILGPLSINGVGEGHQDGDVFVVTGAARGLSLDLVTAASAGGKAEIQESSKEDGMSPDEIKNEVRKAVAEALKPGDGKTEQERRRVTESAPATEKRVTKEADDPISVLSDGEKTEWTKAYDACMGESGDEMVCVNTAWAALYLANREKEQPQEQPQGEQPQTEEAANAPDKGATPASGSTPMKEADPMTDVRVLVAEAVRAAIEATRTGSSGPVQESKGTARGITEADMEKRISNAVGKDAELYRPRS